MSSEKGILITLEYPPDIGGIATYCYNFVKQNPNVEVLHLKISGRRLSWIWLIPGFLKRISKGGYKKIYVMQVLPLGYLCIIALIFFRIQYKVYLHGRDVLQRLSSWKRFWVWFILSEAEEVIANSRFLKERVSEIYRIERCVVRYPSIDVTAIEQEAAFIPPIQKPSRFVILGVGRLVRRKGFDKVIEAMARIKGETHYWIIGDGTDRERLKRLVEEYGLQDYVSFLGAISAPHIYGYYKSCDVFIMTPREMIDRDAEAFGIVFLEAAVFRKPVIGGRSGGVPETVVDGVTGLLVNPLDAKEIASALERILRDEEFGRRLGEEGYERVKREFAI